METPKDDDVPYKLRGKETKIGSVVSVTATFANIRDEHLTPTT